MSSRVSFVPSTILTTSSAALAGSNGAITFLNRPLAGQPDTLSKTATLKFALGHSPTTDAGIMLSSIVVSYTIEDSNINSVTLALSKQSFTPASSITNIPVTPSSWTLTPGNYSGVISVNSPDYENQASPLYYILDITVAVNTDVITELRVNNIEAIFTQSFPGDVDLAQVTVGSTARTVVSKFRESISIKDYGAVGNGVTDDTAAVNAAVAAARAARITEILVPVGNYIISSEIEIPQNIRLQGQGGGQQNYAGNFTGSVFTAASGAFADANDAVLAFVYEADPDNPDRRHFGGAFDLVVNGRRGTGNQCRGIRMAGVRYTSVARCGVYQCTGSGIYVASGGGLSSNDIRLYLNDIMYNTRHGIEFYGGDSFILDNVCAQNTMDGIAGQPGNTIIRGNSCWYNRNGMQLLSPSLNPSIYGNFFYDNNEAGIVLGTVTNAAICGNQINHNGKDAGATATHRCGLLVTAACTGVISGNSFSNTTAGGPGTQQYGISVQDTTNYGLVQSTNNTLIDNVVAPITDLGAFVNLTAASTTLPVGGRISIVLSSNSAVAGARLIVLNSGVVFGQTLVLRWSGTNTGRLVDNTSIPDGGGFIRLTSNWDPTADFETLVLYWTVVGWIELSRCAPA